MRFSQRDCLVGAHQMLISSSTWHWLDQCKLAINDSILSPLIHQWDFFISDGTKGSCGQIWLIFCSNNLVNKVSCSTRSRQTREQVDHQWIISWSYCQNIRRIKQPSLSLFLDGWIDKQCEVNKSDLDQMKTMLTKIYAEWAHKKEIGEQDLAFVNEQKTPTRQKRFQPDKTLADVGVSL